MGSQIDGSILTLCMTKTQVKVKPVAPPHPSTAPKPAPAKSVQAKPVKPKKPNPGVKFAFSKKTGFGSFKPQVEPQNAQPTAGKVSQVFKVSTHQLVRRGWGYLLGQRVQVRFAPVALHWQFQDGFHQSIDAATGQIQHAFKAPGSYPVNLEVTFAVQYRPWGSPTWIREPAKLTLPTNVLVLQVDQPASKGKRVVLLNPQF